MIHELKIWPEYFERIITGKKRFELRKDDRPFSVGDILHLREYNPILHEYTERVCDCEILYILHSTSIVENGYVILSIKLLALG